MNSLTSEKPLENIQPFWRERAIDHERGGFIGEMSNDLGQKNRDQYASSDTRCHVAATTVEKLVDYCKQTPRDPLRSAACVQQRIDLIRKNLEVMKMAGLRSAIA